MLAALEKAVRDDALLATNTSTCSVTVLARALRVPHRLVGMHFLMPAEITAAVEVVRGAMTSTAAVDAACATARAWGKVPVLCDTTPGLVVDRVNGPFFGEAQRLVEERAADPTTVDLLLRDAGGFPMGPFDLSDRVGQDIVLAVTRSIWEQTFHDQRYSPTTSSSVWWTPDGWAARPAAGSSATTDARHPRTTCTLWPVGRRPRWTCTLRRSVTARGSPSWSR